MTTNINLSEKMFQQYQTNQNVLLAIEACLNAIKSAFSTDLVFLLISDSSESEPKILSCIGKNELLKKSLDRLGYEERQALKKISLKFFLDITDKPQFSPHGTLKMQNPSSGIFLASSINENIYIILGLVDQFSKKYLPQTLDEISRVFKNWEMNLANFLIEFKEKIQKELESNELKANLKEAKHLKSNETNSKQRSLILVDEITRLYNLDYFKERLAEEVERGKRFSRSVSLILLQIHSPQLANEEEIAKQISKILMTSLRRIDIICRIAMDKYALILPDTDNHTYEIIVKRIFKLFKSIFKSQEIYLNISASSFPKHALTDLELLGKVENLLTDSLGNGPNKAILPH
jgi:diguanylate cyclase (GGDEF)-like protein